MPYYSAVWYVDGQANESFGDYNRGCVEAEIQDWIDHGARVKSIRRKVWPTVPDNDTWLNWLAYGD
jgi:hypothetical protein